MPPLVRPLPADYPSIRQHLDALEDTLTGASNRDPPLPGSPLKFRRYNPKIRRLGLDWPSTAMTMVGRKRLHNFRKLVERVIRGNVPGDIIETGVWRGGASIMARAVLDAWQAGDRKVIVADSFEGLPPPSPGQWPADEASDLHTYGELAVSLEQVQANFEQFGLLDEQVVFLKGWFRDTMSKVESSRLAIIRLDGDMYESTIDPLVHLYDRLSEGGWVIVDDYGVIPACKQAVHDFFEMKGIQPRLRAIDGIGVFFRKA